MGDHATQTKGRIVKVKLGMVVADSPARAKLGGFLQQRTHGKGCPYCLFDLDDLGKIPPPSPAMRTSAHQQQSLACKSVEGNRRYRELGVRYSILHELPYFSMPTMCPPDYMHAIHLGLCRRFFHDFLILGCKNIGNQLEDLFKVINGAHLPSTAKRPDHRIGKPGGGTPNAEQWLTLFRHQLLFGLMTIWAKSLAGSKQHYLDFQPEAVSQRRPVLFGNKPVEDVFEAAVLLTAIVDLMEKQEFTERDIARLKEFIDRFNRQQANLLGPGWLTYNSHIAEHIPEFIRRYGSRKYHFPRSFERR